jgi:glycosyltransferase involved in cell wall biosynthesis
VTRAPEVSVVLPTRDRPAALRRCLRALARQTLDGTLEVVVVDDGSGSRDAVAGVAAAFPGVRLIRTKGVGPAGARNAGAREARGSIVCLTDDDCEPSPAWAEGLAAAIRAGADASAGSTISSSSAGRAAVASQLIANFVMEAGRSRGRRLSFAPSNNVACRRELLVALPFDSSYPASAGEDRDWCARVADAGYTLVAEQGAQVIHAQGSTLWAFWRRHLRYGRGAHRFRAAHPSAGKRESIAFYFALVRAGFRLGPAVGALICLSQVATVIGRCAAAMVDR